MLKCLTQSGSHVIGVWIESSLLVASGSLHMVVRVLNHVLLGGYLLLLIASLEDVHVGVIFELSVHFPNFLII
jgi:hypothetical protein